MLVKELISMHFTTTFSDAVVLMAYAYLNSAIWKNGFCILLFTVRPQY